jgi:lipopolysaccharide transport system ATP-binding protein
VIAGAARRAGARLLHPLRHAEGLGDKREEFWALRDVAFSIKEGERVGIIGGNGAGKSTLLKILSRIVEPTKGRIDIRGRVASLLEVGTGFHQELTGRENIFLNGAILGMTKQEIIRKFDEIVAFAEVEQFLDTPVKRYSSGMYVRLAFAVAAHLDPEILIVDEVLAVGDAQFQRKCMGKMEEAGKSGRTVLFVSHNMGAIEQLCDRCIFIKKGRLEQDSQDVRGVINAYLFGNQDLEVFTEWTNKNNEFENPWFIPRRVTLSDETGALLQNPARNDTSLWLTVEGDVRQPDDSLAIAYAIYNEDNVKLYETATHDDPASCVRNLSPGSWQVRTPIPKRFFNEGDYRITVGVFRHFKGYISDFREANAPTVSLLIRGGLSDSPAWVNKRSGIVAPLLPWEAVIKHPELR